MTFISVIPARKNSTRLKNKNLKKINGKPLIYYSIQSSIKSKYIDGESEDIENDDDRKL